MRRRVRHGTDLAHHIAARKGSLIALRSSPQQALATDLERYVALLLRVVSRACGPWEVIATPKLAPYYELELQNITLYLRMKKRLLSIFNSGVSTQRICTEIELSSRRHTSKLDRITQIKWSDSRWNTTMERTI
jgi:hypothetical protein